MENDQAFENFQFDLDLSSATLACTSKSLSPEIADDFLEYIENPKISLNESVLKTNHIDIPFPKELDLQLKEQFCASSSLGPSCSTSQATSILKPRLNNGGSIMQPQGNGHLSPIYENSVSIDDFDLDFLLSGESGEPNQIEQAHGGGTNSGVKAIGTNEDSDGTDDKANKKQKIGDLRTWFQNLKSYYGDKIKETNKNATNFRNLYLQKEAECKTLQEKYDEIEQELVHCKDEAFKKEQEFHLEQSEMLKENGPMPYIDLAIAYLKALGYLCKEDFKKCRLQKDIDEIVDFVKEHTSSPHVMKIIKRLSNQKNGKSVKKTSNVETQCDLITPSSSSIEDNTADVVPSHYGVIQEASTSANTTGTLGRAESVNETLPPRSRESEEDIIFNAVMAEVRGWKPLKPITSFYNSVSTSTDICDINREIDFIPKKRTVRVKKSNSRPPSRALSTSNVRIKKESRTPTPTPKPKLSLVPNLMNCKPKLQFCNAACSTDSMNNFAVNSTNPGGFAVQNTEICSLLEFLDRMCGFSGFMCSGSSMSQPENRNDLYNWISEQYQEYQRIQNNGSCFKDAPGFQQKSSTQANNVSNISVGNDKYLKENLKPDNQQENYSVPRMNCASVTKVGAHKSLQTVKLSDKNYNGPEQNSAEFVCTKNRISRGVSVNLSPNKRKAKCIEKKSESKLKKSKAVDTPIVQETQKNVESAELVGNSLLLLNPSNDTTERKRELDFLTSAEHPRSKASVLTSTPNVELDSMRDCVVRVRKLHYEESAELLLLSNDSTKCNNTSGNRGKQLNKGLKALPSFTSSITSEDKITKVRPITPKQNINHQTRKERTPNINTLKTDKLTEKGKSKENSPQKKKPRYTDHIKALFGSEAEDSESEHETAIDMKITTRLNFKTADVHESPSNINDTMISDSHDVVKAKSNLDSNTSIVAMDIDENLCAANNLEQISSASEGKMTIFNDNSLEIINGSACDSSAVGFIHQLYLDKKSEASQLKANNQKKTKTKTSKATIAKPLRPIKPKILEIETLNPKKPTDCNAHQNQLDSDERCNDLNITKCQEIKLSDSIIPKSIEPEENYADEKTPFKRSARLLAKSHQSEQDTQQKALNLSTKNKPTKRLRDMKLKIATEIKSLENELEKENPCHSSKTVITANVESLAYTTPPSETEKIPIECLEDATPEPTKNIKCTEISMPMSVLAESNASKSSCDQSQLSTLSSSSLVSDSSVINLITTDESQSVSNLLCAKISSILSTSNKRRPSYTTTSSSEATPTKQTSNTASGLIETAKISTLSSKKNTKPTLAKSSSNETSTIGNSFINPPTNSHSEVVATLQTSTSLNKQETSTTQTDPNYSAIGGSNATSEKSSIKKILRTRNRFIGAVVNSKEKEKAKPTTSLSVIELASGIQSSVVDSAFDSHATLGECTKPIESKVIMEEAKKPVTATLSSGIQNGLGKSKMVSKDLTLEKQPVPVNNLHLSNNLQNDLDLSESEDSEDGDHRLESVKVNDTKWLENSSKTTNKIYYDENINDVDTNSQISDTSLELVIDIGETSLEAEQGVDDDSILTPELQSPKKYKDSFTLSSTQLSDSRKRRNTKDCGIPFKEQTAEGVSINSVNSSDLPTKRQRRFMSASTNVLNPRLSTLRSSLFKNVDANVMPSTSKAQRDKKFEYSPSETYMTLYDSPASPEPEETQIDEKLSLSKVQPKILEKMIESKNTEKQNLCVLIRNVLRNGTGARKSLFASTNFSASEITKISKIRKVLAEYFKEYNEPVVVKAALVKIVQISIVNKLIATAIVQEIKSVKYSLSDIHARDYLQEGTLQDGPMPQLPEVTAVGEILKILESDRNHELKEQTTNANDNAEPFSIMMFRNIEKALFFTNNSNKLGLNECIALTQLYIQTMCICQQNKTVPKTFKYSPREFIMNSLYYHRRKATPMIYYILCQFPSVLPHRDDRTGENSKPTVVVIKHLLMNFKYDMDNRSLLHRELLSKLRYQYHYEPFAPTKPQVIDVLMTKLKDCALEELVFSFAIFCKNYEPDIIEADVITTHLAPLSVTYYNQLFKSTAYDGRVAALIGCLSIIIKPFPPGRLRSDFYLSLFSRFLQATDRQIVQEAAAQAIVRLQRFDHMSCSQILCDFIPDYDLKPLTSNMMKKFVHRHKNENLNQIINGNSLAD